MKSSLPVDTIGQLCKKQLLLFRSEIFAGCDVENRRGLRVDFVDILAARPGRTGKYKLNHVFGDVNFAAHKYIIDNSAL